MSLIKSEILESTAWEAELRRVNSALRVVGAANKALTVAPDVAAWLNQVCRSAMEAGGYRMAWVGFVESRKDNRVLPVAYAGFEAGHFESIIFNSKDTWRGHGPIGIALRTGKYYVARNIPEDPKFDLLRSEALQHGYKSSIVLPLRGNGRTFGILALYAEEVDAFVPKEIEVLNELASDLAYGLVVVFRTGVQRQSATEALVESQRKLRNAERITHLAQWERELGTNVLTWSDELYRMLGLEPQKRIFRFSEFVELIHPDDRAAVIKAADDGVHRIGKFNLNYRVIRPDGQLRFIHGEGEVIRDKAGQPRRTGGFLQDVTEQHLAKVALEKANRSLETKNIALKEILGNIDVEQGKIGLRVSKNVEDGILPLVQSLKRGATRRQQRAIDQIESSLREIISPFVDELARAVKRLTPTEIRVCTYVKRGLAVKEIAELEHLSPETIAAHRRNIRRKLNIANRKINLASYLREIHRHPRARASKHIG